MKRERQNEEESRKETKTEEAKKGGRGMEVGGLAWRSKEMLHFHTS